MYTPRYWKTATNFLEKNEPRLQEIINNYPKLSFEKKEDPFQSLVRSIIGQQISTSAAQSIWGKLSKNIHLDPSIIKLTKSEKLKSFGLSANKIKYIKHLSAYFLENKINKDLLISMTDDEIISTLTEVKGIGRWTAQMFLMFFLFRPNIFPIDDLGIRKAMNNLYGRKNHKEMVIKSQEWEPWKSVASFYLWKSL